MNALSSQSTADEPAPSGRLANSLVADIGLSCPSCHVQLTLPPAFLGQVVKGPCPVCGWNLIFRHGQIEAAPTPGGNEPVSEGSGHGRAPCASRAKLPRSGTVDVHYLEEIAAPREGAEAGWGAASWPDISHGHPAAAVTTDRRTRWLKGLGLVAGLGLAMATVWLISRPAPPPPAPQLATPGTGAGGPRAIPAGWGEGAVLAWQAFARAATADEKLAHVLDADRVAPILRAFYDAHPGSDEVWSKREFKPLAGTADDRRRGLMALACTPVSDDERPIILFFRTESPAAPEGVDVPIRFRLDWETYIQERDGLLQAFLADESASRRTFRLAIERVHIFDDAGRSPNRGEPLGLKLRTPSGLLLPRVAEVRPQSPLYARLDSQLRWGMPAYATVQLSWDTTTGPLPRVVMTDFVCWHFPGLGGTPEFAADLSPLPPASAPAR